MAIQPKNTNTIAVDVITEKAAAAGVTIDGVLLKDNLVQGNAADFSVSIRGANNTYLRARNAANSADLSLIKADGSDNTRLNAGSGKQIDFSINDVVKTSFNSSGNLVPVADGGQDIGSTALQFSSVYARNLTRTSIGALTITCTDGALLLNSQGASQEIQLATQGTNRWRIDSSRLFPNANNATDIGTSSTQEVRTIYCGTSLVKGSAGNFTVQAAAGTLICAGNGSVDLYVAGTSRWGVDSGGHFKPAINNTYDLGSTSFRARVVYGTTLDATTVNATSVVAGTAILSTSAITKAGAFSIVASSATFTVDTGLAVTDVSVAASKTAENEYIRLDVNGSTRYVRLYS